MFLFSAVQAFWVLLLLKFLLTVVIRLKLLLCLRFLKVHLFLRKWILNSVTSLNLLMKNLKKLWQVWMLSSTQQVLMKELNSLILFMMHTKSIISTQPIVAWKWLKSAALKDALFLAHILLGLQRKDLICSFAISTLISVPVLSRKRLLLNMLMMIWVLQFLNFRILSRADALFGLSLLNSFKDLKKCLSLCIQREALQCLQFARLVKLL